MIWGLQRRTWFQVGDRSEVWKASPCCKNICMYWLVRVLVHHLSAGQLATKERQEIDIYQSCPNQIYLFLHKSVSPALNTSANFGSRTLCCLFVTAPSLWVGRGTPMKFTSLRFQLTFNYFPPIIYIRGRFQVFPLAFCALALGLKPSLFRNARKHILKKLQNRDTCHLQQSSFSRICWYMNTTRMHVGALTLCWQAVCRSRYTTQKCMYTTKTCTYAYFMHAWAPSACMHRHYTQDTYTRHIH
jgi:hypothetical protein